MNVFRSVLTSLMSGRNNVIIGGSAALVLHGLDIGRELMDVDIIIYKPTAEQDTLLNLLMNFDYIKAEHSPRRAMKLKKDGFFIDIIMERNSDQPMPTDFLLIEISGIAYKIQSVKKVVEAKCSYTLEGRSQEPTLYTRRKDVFDLQLLKNLNFNFEAELVKEIQNQVNRPLADTSRGPGNS